VRAAFSKFSAASVSVARCGLTLAGVGMGLAGATVVVWAYAPPARIGNVRIPKTTPATVP